MLPGRKSFLLAAVIFTVIPTSVNGDRGWAEERTGAPVEIIETGKTAGEVIVESEILYEEWEGYVPAGIYTDQSGKQYWLKDWHLESCRIPEHREKAERTVFYEGVEWEEQIPKQAAVALRDRITGQQLQKNYPVLLKECDREYWSADFVFTAVFHSNGSDYCRLGKKRIPFNGMEPELMECEQELFEEINVKPEKYRILNAVWAGDPYQDEEGNSCRNARVTGEKQIADYHVTYGGEAVFPEAAGMKCIAVYRGFDSVTEGWNPAGERLINPEHSSSGTRKREEKWLLYRKSVVITLSILLISSVIFMITFLTKRVFHKKKEME